ncbi:MAG: phosphomannomutase [Ghiorsea sp.]|nr:phosphomannomutase [Ghiorsea sp.]
MIHIKALMESSGVKFGTSGARGLVVDMTDQVCFAYTTAFLQYLEAHGLVSKGAAVAVAGDYRQSSPRIMEAVGLAIQEAGFKPVNCGFVPTPAVAAYAIKRHIPSIMVTGSHIPDDRNGIKFYKPEGEILKNDEQGMCSRSIELDTTLFDERGQKTHAFAWATETQDAYHEFVARYINFLPSSCLKGRRVGVYEHSSVAREALVEIMLGLGADVVRLGHSDKFIPVDTEAVRDEDVLLAKAWVDKHQLDCIVSADGDGDRPLVSDEKGVWLRGDVLGIACAKYLGAEHVVMPVSCNSAVEKSDYFRSVSRTRIGSPFVIEVMNTLLKEGQTNVVGYEANGGFLTASAIKKGGETLTALPTRDAVIVPLMLLLAAKDKGLTLSELMQGLPQRFTASDRLKGVPTEVSQQNIANLKQDKAWFEQQFGEVVNVDETDGFRMTFASGIVVHLRPSGNAPELRCYVEAERAAKAESVLLQCLDYLKSWLNQ